MNHLIEEQAQLTELEPLLQSLCDQGGVVAVDTEFLREKTYNAKLCLVQLGIGEHQYCIDVLKIHNTSILVELFRAENVLKLFHAARQDLEVILQTLEVLPKPIFDTQLAAAFCGADMQIGYGGLVQEVTGIELPKTQSRTDWTRRPLSDEQVKYAGEDVAHLEELYNDGLENLKQQNKLDWYKAELETYYDESLYIIDPETAYKRMSGGMLRIKQQHLLKALSNWRESAAQERDIPRTWVIRDDKLYDLVQANVKSEQEIIELGVFGRRSATYLAPQAMDVIRKTKTGDSVVWRKVEPLTKSQKSLCSSMMRELSALSTQHGVAQALLGTRKDIESLYRNRQSKKLLKGWRETVVGKPLLDFVRSEEGSGQ